MWLLRPNPALNFGFLVGAYAVLSALCALFAALQFVFEVKAVAGFFVVPAPAVPGESTCACIAALDKEEEDADEAGEEDGGRTRRPRRL